MPKLHAPHVMVSAVEFAKHIHANYPGLAIVCESRVAHAVHEQLPFPVYTTLAGNHGSGGSLVQYPRKIDLVTTMGGDGTVLRAASLFSHHASVPPILSFSMGTIGFLGEWKFAEYKRAWREAYMSGSDVLVEDLVGPHTQAAAAAAAATDDPESLCHTGNGERVTPHNYQPSAWDAVRGKSLGPNRASKILLRNRLRVGIYDREGRNINEQLLPNSSMAEPDLRAAPPDGDVMHSSTLPCPASPPLLHAINEVSIDRGVHPHLAIIDIFVNGRFLTEAVADGILISTPTGSTAYSLSAGGSIVHPLVKSLLITPISPRSLSFRPLVLPLHSRVVLRLSKRNRGRELPVSIDGKRRAGVGIGMEVRVEGETLARAGNGPRGWRGGVPCVIRASLTGAGGEAPEDDDSWVGGLNGLLKFNYPFGEPGHGH
ncbi:hypothetical protein P8C59_004038 [Phyllachora maydis]|uniref:Uncharacterized protein n=1 Tax=Phyllachora maydis TaxID=1825666 RepID=A0AAD9I1K2_9PEZI|nr:hypothetical protein P8C59_004038 [Phyllachora maydis]